MSEPNPNACSECNAGRCDSCVLRLMCLCDHTAHDADHPDYREEWKP